MRGRIFVLSAALTIGAGFAVEMITPGGEASSYWPRWRGPSGQGTAAGSGYPDSWSPTENVIWKVAVPGAGNSSPIVWGDRIFLATSHDGGARRSILCLRRSDGGVLWESFAPDADPEKTNRKNGFASSTPVTDGERIYAYLGNHGLLAVDFEGRRVWHRGLGGLTAYHGAAGSPLLYKDSVILYQDQRRPAHSFIAAFDKRTGKTIWWKGREEQVGWGSPVAIRAGDRDEIVVSGQETVYSYHPDTGEVLWTVKGNLYEVTPTPVVGHGLVFCSSGRAGPTLAIRPGGSGDVTDSHVVWRSSKGSPFIPSPLLYDDYLYMVNDMTGIATAHNARTGNVVWQGRLGEAGEHSFSASPVGVDGKLFFTNDFGETFVLRAGPEFQILGVNRLHERTLASPALVDGRWYFRTEKHLLAIGNR